MIQGQQWSFAANRKICSMKKFIKSIFLFLHCQPRSWTSKMWECLKPRNLELCSRFVPLTVYWVWCLLAPTCCNNTNDKTWSACVGQAWCILHCGCLYCCVWWGAIFKYCIIPATSFDSISGQYFSIQTVRSSVMLLWHLDFAQLSMCIRN